MHRRLKWEEAGRQHRRCILAVPFLTLGKVYLKAVEPREVPRRAGEWHTHFLVDSPDIPVHTVALPIYRANRVKGVIERVTIAIESRRVILAANGKGDRPGGKIEQVAVNSGVTYRQLIRTRVMESDINSCSGRRAVLAKKPTERIKRSGRICVQQGIAQPGLARPSLRE